MLLNMRQFETKTLTIARNSFASENQIFQNMIYAVIELSWGKVDGSLWSE